MASIKVSKATGMASFQRTDQSNIGPLSLRPTQPNNPRLPYQQV
jgi:hypothetical protein